jgi:hypothetical protein
VHGMDPTLSLRCDFTCRPDQAGGLPTARGGGRDDAGREGWRLEAGISILEGCLKAAILKHDVVLLCTQSCFGRDMLSAQAS